MISEGPTSNRQGRGAVGNSEFASLGARAGRNGLKLAVIFDLSRKQVCGEYRKQGEGKSLKRTRKGFTIIWSPDVCPCPTAGNQ